MRQSEAGQVEAGGGAHSGACGNGAVRPAPGLAALFGGFLSVGVFGFGGVLPWARRMVVEQRGWASPAEFTDLLALCQFLPGPNIINMSIALGARFRGPAGALAAFLGLMLAPMAIILLLGIAYARYGEIPLVRRALLGLAAAASGLVLATALKIAAPLRRDRPALALALVTFGAVALLHVPLLAAMLVLAPLGMVLAAARRG